MIGRHPAVVAVKGHVKHADQVALVRHDRTLVVLVRHAPDAVLRVVVARKLGLPPERRAELLRAAAAHDNAEHLVLNVGAQDQNVGLQLVVLQLVNNRSH